ncbi:MAG: hypothetical protein Harvfovirus25_9 [Harvfovirus sp.]|uniref:Uncharacterized protein n=1 Tax=Harvfovirus sp. TaxID=2487768 RepID=A0A3G5A2D5_9VIRU|nr:MAG: hypothetical protein Harvfovirus25_9 [Harvfovirus sp.]
MACSGASGLIKLNPRGMILLDFTKITFAERIMNRLSNSDSLKL